MAGAIATQLHDRNNAFTLFATHYFELTEFPREHDRALNVHVSAAENGNDIVFLHDIQPGPASRSYGVQVARLAGMPASTDPPGAQDARSARNAAARGRGADRSVRATQRRPHRCLRRSALDHALGAIEPDMLSPKEALEALYRLKAIHLSDNLVDNFSDKVSDNESQP